MTDTIRLPVGPSGKPVAWATIDLTDYERIIIHRWYLSARGYAFRPSTGKSVFLHREVLGFPISEDIHHRNDDKLDNRRENLEACTHAHNVQLGAAAPVFQIRERICELRLNGWTNQAIATELGISCRSVSRYASHLPRVPHPNLLWTRERLIEVVQRFHVEHGRLPGQRDFDGKNGLPRFTTIYRQFAGMRDFIEAAGFEYVDGRSRRAAA